MMAGNLPFSCLMKLRKSFTILAFIAAATAWFAWPEPSKTPRLEQPAARVVEASSAEAEGLQPSAPGSPDAGALTVSAEALQVPARDADFGKITAFNDWSQRWVAADAAQRESLKAEGVRLAEARRPEMKALIVKSPRMALDHAVPRVILQDLPAEIAGLLERPVSAMGDFNVYRGRPNGALPEGAELTLRYFETADGKSYKARVSEELAHLNSKKSVALRGVAIDREFAVASNPVRQLEKGERISRTAKVESLCPVSGISTPEPAPEEPVTDETPTVEIAERIIRLCNGTHVRVLEEEYQAMLMASGNAGAGFFKDNHPGTSSEAIGNFRCLYIRITYPDQLKAPNTEDSANSDMRNVSRFFLENSFGRMTTTTTVTPVITLPHSQAWYIAKDSEVDGLGLVHSHARAEARKLGYDSNQVNCTIVRVNGGPRLSGISWGGGDSVWVSWDGMDVINHEAGHSLGRNHANFWTTSDGSAIGVGSNQEYGNGFDVMGGGGGFAAHYNTKSKRDLGWLSDAYIHRPSDAPGASGVYRIFAYDQPQLEEGRRYAFRVGKDAQRRFYLEYHPSYNTSLANSLLMIIDGLGSNCGHLIDTTPGSPDGKNDGGIQVGRTFSDFESDIHFTVLSKNATVPPSMDFAYQRGPFPGNTAPVFDSLTASATTISAGGSITFTANATDAEGDTLAYHWEFNDGVYGTNTPTFTRTFSSVDQQTIHCTVSDMKGGSARRHLVVNIGNHGRGVVTGRITNSGVPVQGVRVTSGTGKYAFTDSNGDYAVSDLTVTNHTFSAVLTGYTFTQSFTSPVAVVANTTASGKDWEAASVAELSIVATDAAEGGAPGSFVITRTGDNTAALDVTVAPVGGTATKTTDYTFSPDYVASGSLYKFTIPAGQSSLAVAVTAVNDAAAEGPETVKLQFSVGGYQVRAGGVAELKIADNDTALPVVKLITPDFYAEESGGNGAYVLSRTGATTSALNVAVTWSGSAVNGVDFVAQPTTITIPAGAASATVTLVPTDDATIEVPESATLTLASNASYILDPAEKVGTVTINDDDVPVVSVTALDADASEAGRDPGLVLFTRTGTTAAPLTVYYGLSGRAFHGTDYYALPGQITIPAGATSAAVMVTPYDDDIGEPDLESVTVNLATYDNAYQMSTAFSATVNIADNDDAPLVAVRADSSPSEPSTAGRFYIRAIGSATGNITVNYTMSGTATAGSDYTAPSGSVTLSAASTNEVAVNIPILNDTDAEPTETIVLRITSGASYKVLNDGEAVLRLRDDDSGDRVMVSAWNDSVAEAATANDGKFYFSRGGTTGALDVSYVVSGTAINGTDFDLLSGTVTIPDGATGVDLTVTPINDALLEGTETVTVTVVAGAGYGADIPASATLYIGDDDTSPTAVTSIGFQSATGATTEAPISGNHWRDIPVTLSAAHAETVTVEYTSGGGTASGDDIDWVFLDAANGNAPIPGGVLVFEPGALSKNVRVRIRDDGVSEGDETALLTLKNPRFVRLSGSRTTHTLTISDANNHDARVRFIVAASTKGEGDATEPLLMAVLDRQLTASASVDYSVGGTASAGSDFSLVPGTLTFAPGETVKLLPFTILADGVPEPSETVVVTLSNPAGCVLGTPAVHTISLTDSTRPAVSISGPVDIAESGGTIAFNITRNGATTFPLTVFFATGGSATAPADYAALPASVTIPTGATSVPLVVTLNDDVVEEGDETLSITLSPDLNYDLGLVSQVTTTIDDDDAPPVISIVSPVRPEVAIGAGNGIMLTVDASRPTPAGSVNVPVTWSVISGPGTVSFETSTASTTAASFSATGEYILEVSASYGTNTVAERVKVNVGQTLFSQTIGTTTAAGSFSEADTVLGSRAGGTITLTGAGSGLSSSGTTDGFYFIASPRTGDFDLAIRTASVSNPGADTSCRVGIMARASSAANAIYAFSFHRSDGRPGYQARLTAGTDPYDSISGTTNAFPRWVRLVRVGDLITAYHSANGTTWTQQGASQTVAGLGASPLVGLAITSAVPATASTAVLDSANFYLPTNIAPLVDAGAALSGMGPWTLDATVTDDARPAPASVVPLWLPEGDVTFTSDSTVDTGVSFATSGNYRLRLTASDGAVTTFDDTTANVTVGGPLISWRQLYFGTTSPVGNAADDGDMDGDGLKNIVEFALLTSPVAPGASPLTVARNSGNFVLGVSRDSARTEVNITIESATTIGGTWTAIARSTAGGAFVSLVSETSVAETGSGVVSATITVDTSSTPNARFFRVKVETAP
jgi:hypothetical protein